MSTSKFTVVLAAFVSRAEDGSIDHAATNAKFGTLLQQYEAERETEDSLVVDAISAVFDDHPGARLNKPYVLNTALLSKMACQPAELTILTKRATEYLKANTGERGVAIYGVNKGPGGGMVRWADQPVEAVKPEEKKA